jgi:hypothetical protein
MRESGFNNRFRGAKVREIFYAEKVKTAPKLDEKAFFSVDAKKNLFLTKKITNKKFNIFSN